MFFKHRLKTLWQDVFFATLNTFNRHAVDVICYDKAETVLSGWKAEAPAALSLDSSEWIVNTSTF